MEYRFWKIESGFVYYRSAMLKIKHTNNKTRYTFDTVRKPFNFAKWKEITPNMIMYIYNNQYIKKKHLCNILGISIYKLNKVMRFISAPLYL